MSTFDIMWGAFWHAFWLWAGLTACVFGLWVTVGWSVDAQRRRRLARVFNEWLERP